MEKIIVLRIKGNSYEIKFPNVGQFQHIESLKQILSRGMYKELSAMNTISTNEVLDMVDMESYLTVLTPKLIADLKCKTFGELGLEDYMELKEAYLADFIPWWNEILTMLRPQKTEV